MPFATLVHRALIHVSGSDAQSFLEGLVTSALPQEGQVTGSALLTPQGKILFTFLLSRDGDAFLIECDESELQGLAQRLMLYKLRADVNLARDTRTTMVSLEAGDGLLDLRHPDMGSRTYASEGRGAAGVDYLIRRAELGVLEGPEEIVANTDFPHDVGLDVTGAVSFQKGCFVGQEVVSRVKHRGTARKRPVILKGHGLAQGAALQVGERDIGTVRLVATGSAVAVSRIDKLASAMDAENPVTVGGSPVAVAIPPGAPYTLEPASEAEA